MSDSIFSETTRRLLLQVGKIGRDLRLHLRQGGRISGIVQRAGGALRLKLAFSHLGQGLGHRRISINRVEQQVNEFAEQIVVGFHGDILSLVRRWLDCLIKDQLSAEDRQTAERDFPTILSVFERLFNPETKETA